MELKQPSRIEKALQAAVDAGPDVVGLGGFAAVVGGVYLLFGIGWALIAFGAPTFAGYMYRETRRARARRA